MNSIEVDDKSQDLNWKTFFRVEQESVAFLLGVLVHTFAEIRHRATGAEINEYISSFRGFSNNPASAMGQMQEKAVAHSVKFTSRGWNEKLLNRKAELIRIIGSKIPRRLSIKERLDFTRGIDEARVYYKKCWEAFRQSQTSKDEFEKAVDAMAQINATA